MIQVGIQGELEAVSVDAILVECCTDIGEQRIQPTLLLVDVAMVSPARTYLSKTKTCFSLCKSSAHLLKAFVWENALLLF